MKGYSIESCDFYANGRSYFREYRFGLPIEQARRLEKKKFFQKLKNFLEESEKEKTENE